MPFRTAKEAVELGNNTRYGLAASVWTENIGLALEVALLLKAGSVWVNSHNLFDAAAGFGGYRQSGFGRDGGKEVCVIFFSFFLFHKLAFDGDVGDSRGGGGGGGGRGRGGSSSSSSSSSSTTVVVVIVTFAAA